MCPFDDVSGSVSPVAAYDVPVSEQRRVKLLLQLEHQKNNRWRADAIREGTSLVGKDISRNALQ